MFNFIDNFLNRITMYRLMLYYLFFIWLIGLILSFVRILPYDSAGMVVSLVFILAISWLTNEIFSAAFSVPVNLESAWITGFILALIITPLSPAGGYQYLFFLVFASVWAIASKFLLAIKGKHIFNPAALAVALTALLVGQAASWWVGNIYLIIPVLIGGFLLVRKIRRSDLVISFLAMALLAIIISGLSKGTNFLVTADKAIFYSPLLFFAFVMLTEPLTTPPRRWSRIIYGVLVGLLFSPNMNIGSLYLTPELALLFGNIFSWLVSPKQKLIMTLKEKIPIGNDLWELIFSHDGQFNFHPGQYLEWTVGHDQPDSNGTRRYFTIASAPTEKQIKIGIKFNDGKSSFKRALLKLEAGDKIAASQLAGDFILPAGKEKKLAFIAGGIGITPFRSMIKNILDKNEKRDIVLFYSNKNPEEIVYREIFDLAHRHFGLRTIYTLTDYPALLPGRFRHGRIDRQMILEELPDYRDRTYYISGPHAMVTAYKKILKDLGIRSRRIKTDYFPGFV